MSSLLLLIIALIVLFVAYITYGSWLAKKWGVDPSRPTPAHTQTDGVDYVPTKAPVLLGHHFASIAGAGPINGPILAAVFGWVPVALWVIIGGIFFGAVQDFSSLLASVRHGGKSIGHVIETNIGKSGKRLFIVFAWLTLILVVAAFADIVAGTFNGIGESGELLPIGGTVATSSLLFIVLAVAFGFLVYRRNAPLGIASIVGVILLAVCIAVGLAAPISLAKNTWLWFIGIYIFIASTAPVWILLQPRDYLNSFLLYIMMAAAIVGVVFANPTIHLPAFAGFTVGNQFLFPALFITVACGAISGFHSLVGSGTSAKQIDNEKDLKVIGYGAMLIECVLAILALIAVGALAANGKIPAGTPPQIFANAIGGFVAAIAGGNAAVEKVAVTIVTLAVSAFALTSLDTATRLARYMFQEFFIAEGEDIKKVTGFKKVLVNPYFATLVTVVIGLALAFNGYKNIWPLFGAANQLLAGLALLAVAVWLGKIGKNNKMFYIPMVFMLLATLTALVISIRGNILRFVTGAEGVVFMKEGMQIIFGALLFVLAVILAIQGIKGLFQARKVSGVKTTLEA